MRSAVATCSLSAVLASSALATTYVVNPDGSGDFPSIQVAVSFAGPGDVIELTDGVFLGDGNRDVDFQGKAITVRPQNGPVGCVIDCEGSQSERHRAFYFHSQEGRASSVVGITITGGYHDVGSALYCTGTSPSIGNCVFVGNGSGSDTVEGNALYCKAFGSPLVEDCVFRENAAYAGGAVSSCMDGSATLVGCTFQGNQASTGGAVRI